MLSLISDNLNAVVRFDRTGVRLKSSATQMDVRFENDNLRSAALCVSYNSYDPHLNSVLFFTPFDGHLTSATHCSSKYPLHINYALPEKCA